MQRGSLVKAERKNGSDVGSSGGHRKVEMEGVSIGNGVIGTIEQCSNAAAAQQLAARIIAKPNSLDSRPAPAMTIAELCEHFQHRELAQSDVFRSHSTRRNYIFYLNKWIIPRWKDYEFADVRTVEVETWLRGLPLARSTCAKIRNLMSVVSTTLAGTKFSAAILFASCDKVPKDLRLRMS
jgi:integrase